MRSGSTLECASPFTTALIYEGSESAIVFDSVSHATLRNCQVVLTGKGPARAIMFRNTTADNKWNEIHHVFVQGVQQPRPISGQVGLLFESTTTRAMYWNLIEMLTAMNLDTGVKLSDAPGFLSNGANDNAFVAITVHHCRIGMEISRAATENKIFGLSGSASGFIGENTLLIIGDEQHSPANFNMIFGLVSDQGAQGQAWHVYKGVQNNYIQGTDQSGIGSLDEGTNTVIERIGGGTSSFSVPQLRVQKSLSNLSIKHMRIPLGCSTKPDVADTCTSRELRWPTPFTDSKYTLTCTLSDVTGQPHIVSTHQSAFGITVTIGNDLPKISTGTVQCVAVDDIK